MNEHSFRKKFNLLRRKLIKAPRGKKKAKFLIVFLYLDN